MTLGRSLVNQPVAPLVEVSGPFIRCLGYTFGLHIMVFAALFSLGACQITVSAANEFPIRMNRIMFYLLCMVIRLIVLVLTWQF